VRVSAGQSLVFSPTWFHRIIPPPKDATHWPVTFRAAYVDEIKLSDTQALWPPALSVRHSNNSVCFTRHDLVRALRHPSMEALEGVQRGIPAIGCTIAPVPLPTVSYTVVRQAGLPTAPPFVTERGAMVRSPQPHLMPPNSAVNVPLQLHGRTPVHSRRHPGR
jgi:hypothetical protein